MLDIKRYLDVRSTINFGKKRSTRSVVPVTNAQHNTLDADRASIGPSIETELFGMLAEHGSEAFLAIDAQRRQIVTFNRQVCDLLGRSRDSLCGQDATTLFATESTSLEAILERAGLHEDCALVGIDGYPIWVSITSTPLEHPRYPSLWVFIVRDTTERRLLEREVLAKHHALYAAHAELERVVASLEERNRELAVLGAQLSSASRRALIGELSAGIAHSFNNPLAALASTHRQITAVIEGAGVPTLSEQMQRLTKRSEVAIVRMEKIVQSIRHAHRSGASDSVVRRTSVVDEIEIALTLFDSRLRGIAVERAFSTTLPLGWFPPADLQHVLWNLLDNAILAMPTGGTLRIAAGCGEAGIVVAVEDSGVGLDPALLPTLFQPFNSTRATGTGLGLSTARRLARGWGGDVDVALVLTAPPTLPLPGARFEIRIPTEELPCKSAAS